MTTRPALAAAPDILPPLEGGAERAPLVAGAPPITPRQALIIDMLARRHSLGEIGRRLAISVTGVKGHIHAVAKKLPGDLPAAQRVVAWYRGASEAALTGEALGAPLTPPARPDRLPCLATLPRGADADDQEAARVLARAADAQTAALAPSPAVEYATTS